MRAAALRSSATTLFLISTAASICGPRGAATTNVDMIVANEAAAIIVETIAVAHTPAVAQAEPRVAPGVEIHVNSTFVKCNII